MQTLLHISDLHFGPNHLADRAEALASLAAARQPDWIVVSGDVTRRAKRKQFRAARSFIDSLGAAVLTVPGNHDVPLYRVWERALAPFWAWRRHFSPELETWTGDESVRIVGVNSAFNWTFTGGRVTRRQRRRLRRLLADAPSSCYRIAVVHHNLVGCGRLEDVPRPPLGAKATLRELDEAGADLVLSGHTHQSFVAAGEESGCGAVLLVAGTAACSRGRGVERGRNTCHWIEIGASAAEVSFLRFDRESGDFETIERREFPRRRAAVAGGSP